MEFYLILGNTKAGVSNWGEGISDYRGKEYRSQVVKCTCEIGKPMSGDSCHKTWYKKEKRYKQLCRLSYDDILTLFLESWI